MLKISESDNINDKPDALYSLTQYLDITIKICLDEFHGKNWYEANSKIDYDLWIVLDGEIRMEYGRHEYFLHPMDLFLLYPQNLYNASSLTDTCRLLFVHFDASIGSNHRALNDFPFDGRVPGSAVCRERGMFLDSYESYRHGVPLSYLYLKGCFLTLVSCALQYQYGQVKQPFLPDTGKQSLSRLYPALHYISQNLHNPIPVKDLASVMGISEKYFIALFKKSTGLSPSNYILRLKMEKALEYLHEGRYSVKEVAAMLGYQDPYTFSKAFKKIYGIAPSKII